MANYLQLCGNPIAIPASNYGNGVVKRKCPKP